MKPRVGNLYRIASTEENLQIIRDEIKRYKQMPRYYQSDKTNHTDLTHCAAMTANSLFKLTNAQWNSCVGGEYYAAVLAVVVHFDLWEEN